MLLIPSDKIFDSELAVLSSFWMWDPAKDKWVYIRDWEEHKREAMLRLEEYIMANSTCQARRKLIQ